MNDRLPEDEERRLPLRVTLQIDALCDEFESALDGPETPLLSPFVDRVDPYDKARLLEELVGLAIEHLQKHGIKDAAGTLLQANESLRDELTPLIPDVAATALHSPSDANQPCVGRGLHIRCPHCHNPIELVSDGDLESIHCTSCGSDFSLTSEGMETRDAREVTQIGHFKLVERIGMGAFGSVWKALDLELDRTVAVKIPRHGNLQQDTFLREARAAAQLHHPNIVPVHEVGHDRDSLYIVSDFIRGITLADWLTGQQLTTRETAQLCVKIAKALHYAHEHGVIHRDMKPGNIMIGEEGEPHLMDFGLARREAGEITMTLEGQVLGTPAYMSPEQAQGEAHTADRTTDIYSVGVILFHLLTGELPFRGNTRMLIHQVIHDDPPSLRKLNSTVPKDLETITLKCLRKQPEHRYQTACLLADDLWCWLADEPIHARPTSQSEKTVRWCRKRPALSASLAALILVTATGFIGVLWQWRRADIARRDALDHSAESERQREEAFQQRTRAEKNAVEAQKSLTMALTAVDQMLMRVGFNRLSDVPEMMPVRQALLEDALKLYETLLVGRESTVTQRAEMARARYLMALILQFQRKYQEADHQYRQAISHFHQLLKEDDSPSVRMGLAGCYLSHAENLNAMSANSEVLPAAKEAVELLEVLHTPESRDTALMQQLATSYRMLASELRKDGKRDESDEAYRKTVSLYDDLAQLEPSNRSFRLEHAWEYWHLGDRMSAEGRYDEAEAALRVNLKLRQELAKDFSVSPRYWLTGIVPHQVPQSEHRFLVQDIIEGHAKLAGVLAATNRQSEATELFKEALRLAEASPVNGYTATKALMNLGAVLDYTGLSESSSVAFEKALANNEVELSKSANRNEKREDAARCYSLLCDKYRLTGTLDKLFAASTSAALHWQDLVSQDPDNLDFQFHLVDALIDMCNSSDLSDGEEVSMKSMEQAVKLSIRHVAHDPYNAVYQHRLGRSYMARARTQNARKMAAAEEADRQRAADIFSRILPNVSEPESLANWIRTNRTTNLQRLAELYKTSDRSVQSFTTYCSAIESSEQLIRRVPNAAWLYGLRDTCVTQAIAILHSLDKSQITPQITESVKTLANVFIVPSVGHAAPPTPLQTRAIGKWKRVLTNEISLSNWVGARHQCEFSDSGIEMKGAEHTNIFYNVTSGDMAIQARVQYFSGHNLHLIVRHRDGEGLYSAWFNGKSEFGVGKRGPQIGWIDFVKCVILDRRSEPFDFAFAAVGDVLTVYVEGKPIMSVRDSTFSEGSPGLGIHLGHGSFSDVDVRLALP